MLCQQSSDSSCGDLKRPVILLTGHRRDQRCEPSLQVASNSVPARAQDQSKRNGGGKRDGQRSRRGSARRSRVGSGDGIDAGTSRLAEHRGPWLRVARRVRQSEGGRFGGRRHGLLVILGSGRNDDGRSCGPVVEETDASGGRREPGGRTRARRGRQAYERAGPLCGITLENDDPQRPDPRLSGHLSGPEDLPRQPQPVSHLAEEPHGPGGERGGRRQHRMRKAWACH